MAQPEANARWRLDCGFVNAKLVEASTRHGGLLRLDRSFLNAKLNVMKAAFEERLRLDRSFLNAKLLVAAFLAEY